MEHRRQPSELSNLTSYNDENKDVSENPINSVDNFLYKSDYKLNLYLTCFKQISRIKLIPSFLNDLL